VNAKYTLSSEGADWLLRGVTLEESRPATAGLPLFTQHKGTISLTRLCPHQRGPFVLSGSKASTISAGYLF